MHFTAPSKVNYTPSQLKDIPEVTLGFSCYVFFQHVPVLVREEPSLLLVPVVFVSATQRGLVEQRAAFSLSLQQHTSLLVGHLQLRQPHQGHSHSLIGRRQLLECSLESNQLQQGCLPEDGWVDGQTG